MEAPTPHLPPLMQEQHDLEQEMLDGGLERIRRMETEAYRRGDPASAAGPRYLLRHLIVPIAQALERKANELLERKAGRHAVSLPYVLQCGFEEAAFIALRGTLNKFLGDPPRVSAVAYDIGRAIETELWMQHFKAAARDKFKATVVEAKKWTDPRIRSLIARRFAKANIATQQLPRKDVIHLGLWVLDSIIAHGLVSTLEVWRTEGGSRRMDKLLILSEASLERMAEVSRVAGLMAPQYLPCVVPPKPWTGPYSGAYHSGLFRNLHLVKTRSRGYLEELANYPLVAVLRAVNAAQDTPWRVHEGVLGVLKDAVESRRPIGGLPDIDVDIPPFPEAEKDNEEVVLNWRRAASKAHEASRKNQNRLIDVSRTVAIAERFKGRDIWFPYQMDFRGRLYPLPVHLQPQGADWTKALLTFARAYPIDTDEAEAWLARDGANRYGVDKCSLLHREEWTRDHRAQIVATAEDPWGPTFDFWTAADKPWQFLAWCFEWAAFLRHGRGFMSSLPVSLDGTCNGLQHYSAAFRDPVGGAAVNLTPTDKPSDIYGEVAERTLALVKLFLQPGGPGDRIPNLPKLREFWKERKLDPIIMAQRWIAFGLDRKITKRSVMTLPYGSTHFSSRGFVEDAIFDKAGAAPTPFYKGGDSVERRKAYFNASLWLQPLLWQAIGETVVAARQGMEWLQKCATILAKENVPITWRTPDGLLVLQYYPKVRSTRIAAILEGQVFKPRLRESLPEVEPRAQAQGVAPNWVHSMDACAMRMFVNAALDEGVQDFALVHDSFGVPAAHVGAMARALRESFVAMYEETDPVTEFYLDMIEQAPDEGSIEALPAPPKKGTLDLKGVLKADYFFA